MGEESFLSDVVFDSIEAVPEGLQTYLSETDDGKFRIAGLAPKGRVDEFRANNIKLQKQAEEMRAKLKELEEAKASLEEQVAQPQPKSKGGDEDDDDMEEVLSKRTASMKEQYEAKLAAATKEREKAQKQLEETLISMAQSTLKTGVAMATKEIEDFVAGATDDALLHAREIWKWDPDQKTLVPRREDGSVWYGSDGVAQLSFSEWLENQRQKKPHWFKAPGSGGGSKPSRGGSGGKTMTRAQFDQLPPVKQMEVSLAGVDII